MLARIVLWMFLILWVVFMVWFAVTMVQDARQYGVF